MRHPLYKCTVARYQTIPKLQLWAETYTGEQSNMAASFRGMFSAGFRSILVNFDRIPSLTVHHARSLHIHSKGIKRFYKNVSITQTNGGYEINLDQRRAKTPMGKILQVPNEAAALAIAAEWDAQDEMIRPSTMHFTKLANTVVDNPTHRTEEQIINGILEYLDTDTVSYRIDEPEEFVEIQKKFWDTLVTEVEKRYGVELPVTSGFQAVTVPEKTKSVFRQHLLSHNKWSLTGYQFTVEGMKSFIIAMALCDRMVSVEDAVYLSRLEQEFQAEKWGRVEWYHDIEVMDTRAKVAAASTFVHLFSEQRDVKQKGQQPNV